MKNAITTALILMMSFAQAQKCDSLAPNVQISTSCHSICVPGTFKIDTAFCGWFVMTASGASSYTWSIGSTTIATGAALTYSATSPGVTNYVVTGSVTYTDGLTCYGTAVISVTAVICANGTPGGPATGVIENGPVINSPPVYYDLQGNRVERRAGTVMIERTGTRSKKVYISQ